MHQLPISAIANPPNPDIYPQFNKLRVYGAYASLRIVHHAPNYEPNSLIVMLTYNREKIQPAMLGLTVPRAAGRDKLVEPS